MAKRRYFTMNELVDEALTRLRETEEWNDIEGHLLDYLTKGHENPIIRYCYFDPIAVTTFGGSEGVYTTVTLTGNWATDKEHDEVLYAVTMKTLHEGRDAYLRMSHAGALLSLAIIDVMNDNLDRFD